MTLMEVLAVCVLLGLVAVAIAPAVARRRQPPVQAFAEALRQADQELRLRAHGVGARWERRAFTIEGTVGGAADAAVVVEIPQGVTCTWRRGDRTLEELAIDPWGRSADLAAELEGGGQRLHLRCDGLVGAWRVEAEP
jgi:hypothetical protein